MPETILIVDDEPGILTTLGGILSDEGYETLKTPSAEEALALLPTLDVRAAVGVAEGRVLRFGGGDWSVVGIDGVDGRPGRVELALERGR